MKKFLILIALAVPMELLAQTIVQDTLPPSVKVALASTVPQSGKYTVEREFIRKLSSPTGEADVMKFVQMLPGIATGAEGSSSYYARGANLGNNVITLDGVPLYSTTHLLGLSSSFSSYVIESTEFYVGGFTSEEGNLTASHVKMKSADGDFKSFGSDVSVSNFLISAGISTPIVKDRLSFIGSFRISPLGLEYRALKNVINKYQSLFTDFSATSFDGYGKLKYLINDRHSISLSFFDTYDRYSISRSTDAKDHFGWGNYFANMQYDGSIGRNLQITGNLTFNNNASHQSMERVLSDVDNCLEIQNKLKEWTFSSTVCQPDRRGFRWQSGLKVRIGTLNPGSSGDMLGNPRTSVITTAHAEAAFERDKIYEFRASARINAYVSDAGVSSAWQFNPELSLLARYRFSPKFGIEATADYLTQYYHSLEGIPMGWSLDMIVPSDKVIKPEQSLQGYAGFFGDFGQHHIVVGGYYKKMKNLVYYADAKKLFNPMLAGWHENVEIGTGTSYGAEFQYEKTGKKFSYKLAYTWSKTDRLFKNLNKGKPFPSKFDRRHIVNVSADYLFVNKPGFKFGINTLFTFQSGHWETTRARSIKAWRFFTEEEVELPYSPNINNYQMPNYIRWDNNLSVEIINEKVSHMIRLGVYNTLNHHNPFALIYDEHNMVWKTLSLIPIMPSLYYSIAF